jgi:undecaprenyl-diphosphatase
MSLASLDFSLERHANVFAVHHDGIEDVARAYAGVSEALFLALVAGVVAVGLLGRKRRLVTTGLLALAATGAALLVAHVVSILVDRPRPFVAHPVIHPFLAHAADASFPSDHATAAFAIAGVLYLRGGVRWLPVLIAAVALAVSRVLIGLHYPGDVLAGALIGSLAAALVSAGATRRIALPRVLVARP